MKMAFKTIFKYFFVVILFMPIIFIGCLFLMIRCHIQFVGEHESPDRKHVLLFEVEDSNFIGIASAYDREAIISLRVDGEPVARFRRVVFADGSYSKMNYSVQWKEDRVLLNIDNARYGRQPGYTDQITILYDGTVTFGTTPNEYDIETTCLCNFVPNFITHWEIILRKTCRAVKEKNLERFTQAADDGGRVSDVQVPGGKQTDRSVGGNR